MLCYAMDMQDVNAGYNPAKAAAADARTAAVMGPCGKLWTSILFWRVFPWCRHSMLGQGGGRYAWPSYAMLCYAMPC